MRKARVVSFVCCCFRNKLLDLSAIRLHPQWLHILRLSVLLFGSLKEAWFSRQAIYKNVFKDLLCFYLCSFSSHSAFVPSLKFNSVVRNMRNMSVSFLPLLSLMRWAMLYSWHYPCVYVTYKTSYQKNIQSNMMICMFPFPIPRAYTDRAIFSSGSGENLIGILFGIRTPHLYFWGGTTVRTDHAKNQCALCTCLTVNVKQFW